MNASHVLHFVSYVIYSFQEKQKSQLPTVIFFSLDALERFAMPKIPQ